MEMPCDVYRHFKIERTDPPHALCDGVQSLTMPDFATVAREVRRLDEARREFGA